MSPDQLNGEIASAAWDLWALAVITYEMLTGAHPFPATSLGQMHHSIVCGRFTPLSTLLPDAPGEWQQFFERALNPKTTARPQSAKEFVSALSEAFAFAAKALPPQ
jgi:serine/threonine-protein kinase